MSRSKGKRHPKKSEPLEAEPIGRRRRAALLLRCKGSHVVRIASTRPAFSTSSGVLWSNAMAPSEHPAAQAPATHLSIEQWGRALVLSVEGAPAGTTEMVGQLLAASLQRALGRDAEVVAFALDERTAYLVVSADTARKVAELVGTGAGLGQVVESLHEGAA